MVVRGVPIDPKKFLALRELMEKTQEEFAQTLNVVRATVARMESEEGTRIDRSTLRAMAERLKITPEELKARIGANGHAISAPKRKPTADERIAKMLSDFSRQNRTKQIPVLKLIKDDREIGWLGKLFTEELGERNAVKPPLGQIKPDPQAGSRSKRGKKHG